MICHVFAVVPDSSATIRVPLHRFDIPSDWKSHLFPSRRSTFRSYRHTCTDAASCSGRIRVICTTVYVYASFLRVCVTSGSV